MKCYICGKDFKYDDESERPVYAGMIYKHEYCKNVVSAKFGLGWIFVIMLVYMIIGFGLGWSSAKEDSKWVKYTPTAEITPEYINKLRNS